MLNYSLEVKFHYGKGYCGIVVNLNRNPADSRYFVGYIFKDWGPVVSKNEWSYYVSSEKLLRAFAQVYANCQYEASIYDKAAEKSKDKVGLYSYVNGVFTKIRHNY